jgi:carbamoyl-phosphate synthase large subunit
MEIVHDDESLKYYMEAAVGVTPDRPILIDRFLHNALECEADAISDGEAAFVPAVMEHIELAGIHSGDSACIIPSLNISKENIEIIKDYTVRIAKEMNVYGLMNMQYAIEDGVVYVLEANPRASRTVPLVSKVCNIQMVRLATQIMVSQYTGEPSPVNDLRESRFAHYGIKEAVFPFNMFPEVDPVLGPEMRSTGEVLGLAQSFGEAFYKAQEATDLRLPLTGTVLISVNDRDKAEMVEVAKGFAENGFKILATGGSYEKIIQNNIPAEKIHKLGKGRPNILDAITNGQIDIIVNTAIDKKGVDDSYIRKAAIKGRISYVTTMAAAKATIAGIKEIKLNMAAGVRSLQELHSQIE